MLFVPHYFHQYAYLLPEHSQLLGLLLLAAFSFAISFVYKLLALDNHRVDDIEHASSYAGTFRDGPGYGSTQIPDTPAHYQSQSESPSSIKSNSPYHGIIRPPTHHFTCATEFGCDAMRVIAMAGPSRIALHCPENVIYRFAPGRTITVSIDIASFRNGGINGSMLQSLQYGLESALAEINRLQLGLQFNYIGNRQRGLVELRYGNDKALQYNGQNYTCWAETTFPGPNVAQYTVLIYAPTFLPQYNLSIPNILAHEFAHLLSMRHWNAGEKESAWPSVQYPPGDIDPKSIMGRFDHPGQLRFHDKDIVWLRRLYTLAAGAKIGGKTVKDV